MLRTNTKKKSKVYIGKRTPERTLLDIPTLQQQYQKFSSFIMASVYLFVSTPALFILLMAGYTAYLGHASRSWPRVEGRIIERDHHALRP